MTQYPVPSTPVSAERKSLRWLKRVIVAGVTLIVVTIVAGAYLLRRAPSWYARPALTVEQRDALARHAENELLRTREFATAAWAAEGQATSNPSPKPMVVRLTQDELNSLIAKWDQHNGWRSTYEQYVADPVVVFRKDRVIVAGMVRDFGAVVGLQFGAKVGKAGDLDVDLVRVTGGNLPMPERMYGKYRDKLVNALRAKLPNWQRAAAVRPDGTTNNKAVIAGMSKLLLSALQDNPADAVVFLPLDTVGRGSVPVRVTDVDVEDGSVSMTIVPMTAPQRQAMIQRLKEPVGLTATALNQ
jgi:uncharacterized protein YpmS